MAKYVKEKVVTECFFGCDFFETSGHIMQCTHPDFEGIEWEKRLIITMDNSRKRVPAECPLRKGATDIIMRVKLEE